MLQDFSSPVFFFKPLLVQKGTSRNKFKFFQIFMELFVFVIDSPVMNTLGSWLESLGEANYSNIIHMSPSSYSHLQSIFRMTFSLKIFICSLKSIKQLHTVQNDSPLMNTSGSIDYPVVNIPRSFDSPVENTPGSLDSPVMNTPGSQLLGVLGRSIRTG